MKSREYAALLKHARTAESIAKRIARLDSFLRGLKYRLRENPTAELILHIRRDRRGCYDPGVEVRLEAARIGRLILPLLRAEMRAAKRELAAMPAALEED